MQRDILSQDEIDLLVRYESSDEQPESTPQAFDSAVAMPYDFSAHGALTSGRIRSLENIHTRFSRLLSQSLSSFLARLVEVEVFSSDILTFGEFIRTLPLPVSLHLITMRPLHGAAVMVFDSTLVFSIIDCLFGGSGRSQISVEGREFTAIEQRVIGKVVLQALEELQKAWEPVYALSMRLERSEVNPNLVTVVPPKDMVVIAIFQARLRDITGFFRICIPYALLQPIKSVLDSSLHTTWVDVDQNWISGIRRELLKAEVEVVAELGCTSIDTHQFLALQAGDLIPLQQGVNEPLLIKIQHMPKAKALPGTINGWRAIKVASLHAREGG